ncbi:MAG: 4-alpha-glucanotransferase [SAR324 cluster bacterium]|uniref:4-alpha-glucanotransferase n=1 Tax=SAR324 cluster bacterium TaxID=2024889 RepID=A0A7X9FRJ7_9DELT|nr:4-alpha-glucanotransferase [SAR324 cluster bacterium]
MEFDRSAGVLLHITSLPAPYGIGDLGQSALDFIDWTARAGLTWWQMLPLGPAADAAPARINDPYSSQSSWAGSPLYLSLHELVKVGDLKNQDIASYKVDGSKINYLAVTRSRQKLFKLAAKNFFLKQNRTTKQVFTSFCRKEAHWLDDWALFSAAKEVFLNKPWWEWPIDFKQRNKRALTLFSKEYQDIIQVAKYIQFRWFEQWARLKAYAKKKGVGLIGDVPIYCAADSVDVWAAPKMFKLRADGQPRAVAGVPPDYFSRDGQLWGTPVYDWAANARDGFRWWIWRLKGYLRTVDVARVDHFRGFEAYWEIPFPAKNARKGKWVKGPGHAFFAAVRKALGEVPLIAEDLGFITGAVNELRAKWELPGMRVTQFAFSGNPRNCHLPMWHETNSVAYTGTHDNETSLGWYKNARKEIKEHFRFYTGSDGKTPHTDLLKFTFSSVARLAVVPVQDVLGLDNRARVNTPGQHTGLYRWKLKQGQLSLASADTLRYLAERYARVPGLQKKQWV